MGYNISALPKHILQSENTEKFLTASILGSQTLDFLSDAGSFTEGLIGGTEPVNIMKTDLVYQDGKLCKLEDLGSVTLTQSEIYVKPIAFMQGFCSLDLNPTWKGEDMKAKKKGKVLDEITFADAIIENLTATNKKNIERNIWQMKVDAGDASSFDGFLEQLKTGTAPLGTIAPALKVYEKIIAGFLAMPTEVTGAEDFKIFIGSDLYNQYVAEISALNLFNALAPDAVHGTSAKFLVVDGLNGTKKAVLARARNLQGKTDITSEGADLQSFYVEKEDTMYLRNRFGLGVKPVFINEIGVLNLA
ncbi:hypothetical protein [Sphingobacterium sp. IITKGP-BTPF85]|uniref:hypothetical protein n=1 Tax=Sphingobacterium sp. IITKGP-BTPF85 TaxID=1338009 RepID=UPI000389E213|nr:hypothetical protein [Sphingobacterium sp. IITKGP-BTPF85]KKX49372.1 hypothetical protein L950_0216035 [Sphingobacterium sp. IITKGP-BTPF85]